jgi:hypothetical protein
MYYFRIMKLSAAILGPIVFFPFILKAQITIQVFNKVDSSAIYGVLSTNMKTNSIVLSNEEGELHLNKGGNFILVHPSFSTVKLENINKDSVVFLEPLVRDIEEVVIVSITNEKLFKKVINKYRSNLENSQYSGKLVYKNTNWFNYFYETENLVDSASCTIEDLLYFDFSGATKKSSVLFSSLDLNRSCTNFSLPRNQDIKTGEISAFSKFDFSHFLNAIFTKDSYFDEIGFDYKTSTKRIDTLTNAIELKFLSDQHEKTMVFSASDSTLISYQCQSFGKLGGYHYYFATFQHQKVQSLYEEKGYLFDYETQNHQFVSIHYGFFVPDTKIPIGNLATFSEIIKTQLDSKEMAEKPISELLPLYLQLLYK